MKFTKIRNKNEWKATNEHGKEVRIALNTFAKEKPYTLNCGTFFYFGATKEDCINEANTNFRFN